MRGRALWDRDGGGFPWARGLGMDGADSMVLEWEGVEGSGRETDAWKGNARWRWPATDRSRSRGLRSGGLDHCFRANWLQLSSSAGASLLGSCLV
jgi:hypothetical protein